MPTNLVEAFSQIDYLNLLATHFVFDWPLQPRMFRLSLFRAKVAILFALLIVASGNVLAIGYTMFWLDLREEQILKGRSEEWRLKSLAALWVAKSTLRGWVACFAGYHACKTSTPCFWYFRLLLRSSLGMRLPHLCLHPAFYKPRLVVSRFSPYSIRDTYGLRESHIRFEPDILGSYNFRVCFDTRPLGSFEYSTHDFE